MTDQADSRVLFESDAIQVRRKLIRHRIRGGHLNFQLTAVARLKISDIFAPKNGREVCRFLNIGSLGDWVIARMRENVGVLLSEAA